MTDSYHGDISTDTDESLPVCEFCERPADSFASHQFDPFCSRLCRNDSEKVVWDCCHDNAGFPTQLVTVKESGAELVKARLCRHCVSTVNGNPDDRRQIDGWKSGDPEDGPWCPDCGSYGHTWSCDIVYQLHGRYRVE